MYGVSPVPEVANGIHVTATKKCRLKPKINAPFPEMIDFKEHESSRSKGSGFRRKGRNTLRDEIGVDEILAISVTREKFTRKGGFTGAVRSRDDIDVWFHEVLWLSNHRSKKG